MTNNLGIDDDDAELLTERLEMSFGICFTDRETSTILTVGDIWEVLTGRFSGKGSDTHKCASAMAFYRLRRAAVGMQPDKIKPETSLVGFGGMTPKRFLQELENRSGLTIPSAELSRTGCAGVLLEVVGFGGLVFGLVIPFVWGVVFGAAALGGLLLVKFDPRELSADLQNFGDLVRKVTALNYGDLVRRGAAPRHLELWNALIEVLSEYSRFPRSEIGLDTVLLESQRKSA
jgi:hypothetical protein